MMSQSAKTMQKKGTKSSERELLTKATELREMRQYKAHFDEMARETRQEEQAEKSLQNKQKLDKYAATQRAKVRSGSKKTSKQPAKLVATIATAATGKSESWEVAPDTSKTCTEVTEDKVIGEAKVMVRIYNHRKKTGGPAEMLMEADNGERYWTSVEIAYKDGRSIVSAYIAENNLQDSDFEPKQMKKTKKKKSAMAAQVEGMKCSQKEQPEVEQMKCSHGDHVGGYLPEENCQYFVPQYGLGNCCCAVCQKKFVPVAATTVEECRPSSSKPAYMCVNRLHGCTHGMCYDCFTTKGMSSLKLKRSRSTRGTSRKN